MDILNREVAFHLFLSDNAHRRARPSRCVSAHGGRSRGNPAGRNNPCTDGWDGQHRQAADHKDYDDNTEAEQAVAGEPGQLFKLISRSLEKLLITGKLRFKAKPMSKGAHDTNTGREAC